MCKTCVITHINKNMTKKEQSLGEIFQNAHRGWQVFWVIVFLCLIAAFPPLILVFIGYALIRAYCQDQKEQKDALRRILRKINK